MYTNLGKPTHDFSDVIMCYLTSLKNSPGAQSFTSLMVDLCLDINRISSFSRCLNGTFPGRNCSVKTLEP